MTRDSKDGRAPNGADTHAAAPLEDEDDAELSPQDEAHLRAALGALGDPRDAEVDDATMLSRVLASAQRDSNAAGPEAQREAAPVIALRPRPRAAVRRSVAATIAGIAIAATLVAAFAAQRLGFFAPEPAPTLAPSAPSEPSVAPARPPVRAPQEARAATEAPSAAPEPSAAPSASASAEPAKASSAAPSATSPSAEELLKRAQDEYTAGNTAGATAAYRALLARYPSSAEARAALISLGQLALRGGRADEALADFDRYLAGGGPLSIEARVGRISALRSLGRSADERAAITDFLARHPGSVHAARLTARLAELSGP
jgi:hypothetical protein